MKMLSKALVICWWGLAQGKNNNVDERVELHG